MSQNETSVLNTLFIATAFILPGCSTVSTPTAWQTLGNNPEYLSKNFTSQSVLTNVLSNVPTDKDAVVNFRKLVITQVGNVENTNSGKLTLEGKTTFIKTGSGLIQSTLEISNNQIPYEIRHAVSYKGMINLRWQVIRTDQASANPIQEIKTLGRLDAIPSRVGDEFVMQATSAKLEQSDFFSKFQRKCKAYESSKAELLHPKLSGQAIAMDCEYLPNDTLASRSKWMLLKDYGVAVMMENKSSTRKDVMTITNVEIEN